MTSLSVNLNKFALLRNARGGNMPDILSIAKKCVAAGANGITVHPRPDQRHTRYDDVFMLAEYVASCSGVEFNVEGNPIEKFIDVVLEAKPDQCTLVPDDPGQLTSDHGWDLSSDHPRLAETIRTLKDADIRVSIFLDPDCRMVDKVPSFAPDRIELYTEAYANAYGTENEFRTLDSYITAASYAQQKRVGVNAGHDLNLDNLLTFLRAVPGVLEVSIGHALVCESFDYTLERTIEKYLDIIVKSGSESVS
jgi:pyridoxine 5-phosphate synthase